MIKLLSTSRGHTPSYFALVFWALIGGTAFADSVVVINEIHYHPTDAGEMLEFVELQNQMSVDIDIAGWVLNGVGEFTIPSPQTIPAGGFVVIARDPAALAAATGYNGSLGPYTGALDNGGEPLTLRNHNGRVMDEVTYNNNWPWPVAPDGSGATLARIRRDTAGASSASWAASRSPNGTPGATNSTGPSPRYANLEISEISAATDSAFFVELRNLAGEVADIGGLVLSDGVSAHTLPAKQLAGGGHIAIGAAALGFVPLEGEPLFLLSSGELSIIDAVRVRSNSRARGNDDPRGEFHQPSAPTPSAANAIDLESRITINEILYHHAPHLSSEETQLFDHTDDWKYEQSGADLGDGWVAPSFDDASWPSGLGVHGFESDAELKALIGTKLDRFIADSIPDQPVTYYFRKSFDWAGPEASLHLDQPPISSSHDALDHLTQKANS